jgi:hypothetical protein
MRTPGGVPPKPLEEVRRIGNPGRRPLPAVDAVTAPGRSTPVPQPVRPLATPGQQMWDRMWSAGATWLWPNVDVEAVQLACELMDERASLRTTVMQYGMTAERVQLRAVEKHLMTLLGALGWAPGERARIARIPGGPTQQSASNDLDDFLIRRQQRDA